MLIIKTKIEGVGEKTLQINELHTCKCKISTPAKSFNDLVELVKQAEEVLIENGFTDMGDRISILRGIYYGTEWSLDYLNEQSKARNFAFNEYVNSSVVCDARKVLKCSEECKSGLFDSLFNSFEVFDSKYKAVDFGHLIIGLDSRRSWRSKNFSIPTQGGTGLEINTWLGDLGGGVGKLALDRLSQPLKKSKTLFPISGSSYGAMVNLEGDIASYVVGMNIKDETQLHDCTETYSTIYETLSDYFNNKWDKRAYYFLRMLGGIFEGDTLINEEEIVSHCAEAFEDFSYWYLGVRMKEKGIGEIEQFSNSSCNFKPISQEVASIFINGLLHVCKNPNDMITARIDPNPLPSEETNIKKINDYLKQKIEQLYNINPF